MAISVLHVDSKNLNENNLSETEGILKSMEYKAANDRSHIDSPNVWIWYDKHFAKL